MRTQCCNAAIVKSSLRSYFYCKNCKRVIDDRLLDLFQPREETYATRKTKAGQQALEQQALQQKNPQDKSR